MNAEWNKLKEGILLEQKQCITEKKHLAIRWTALQSVVDMMSEIENQKKKENKK